ncbi:type II toxin-antitoxin system VapC family toxin [Nitrospiraceae bacterium AH_259_D15_M11_P09]|nr:type II toxin-antitoxin system VapC family toxin [Nitrospiraceae bacterium AH_259_D15_M11_P09]
MTEYVVDASVGIKWFIPEPYSDAARRMRARQDLHVPELFSVEVGNALCKRVRRGDLSLGEAEEIFDDLQELPLHRHADNGVLPVAFNLANKSRQSLYDALYLALAVMINGQLVTADRKLFSALAKGPLRRHLCWVEDIPES